MASVLPLLPIRRTGLVSPDVSRASYLSIAVAKGASQPGCQLRFRRQACRPDVRAARVCWHFQYLDHHATLHDADLSLDGLRKSSEIFTNLAGEPYSSLFSLPPTLKSTKIG